MEETSNLQRALVAMEETANEEVVTSGNEEFVTLASLPDEILQLVITAFSDTEDDPPLFYAVKGLGCVSKGMRQQLHRLQPLVGVRSLAVVQRPAHGPWCVTLLYDGELTEAVVEQARQGRVHSIGAVNTMTLAPRITLAPVVARRVVPELLGAGCSLLKLDMWSVRLDNTWALAFGEAAVCSPVLRTLRIFGCALRGPLPELRLPALQVLDMNDNQLTGGLEPLQSCAALQELFLNANQLAGGLEPLRGCTALQQLDGSDNQLTGELKPLKACTALQHLSLHNNLLTGDLKPLRRCTALQLLLLHNNKLIGGLEPLQNCTALQRLNCSDNQLIGELDPLKACQALQELDLSRNQHLRGGLEPLQSCTALEALELSDNQLTGGLTSLRGCTALKLLDFKYNRMAPTDEDKAHFEHLCYEFLSSCFLQYSSEEGEGEDGSEEAI